MKKVSILVAALFLITALAGCGALEKAEEKASEKVLEEAMGGDVKVDIDGDKYTYEDNEGNRTEFGGTEWPTDEAAAFIPKFNKGTITASSLVSNVYLVEFEEVKQADYDSYLQEIKDAGFTEQALMMDAEGYYQYQAGDSNGNYITLSYEAEKKGLQIMGSAAAKE